MRTAWSVTFISGTLLVACGGGLQNGVPPGQPPQVALVDALPGAQFEQPTALAFAPGAQNDIFVVEQAGQIWRASLAGGNPQLFLDLRDRVLAGGEQGLLGLAFDPEFPDNGWLYVNYTAGNPRRTVVARFAVAGGSADPDSESVLLSFEQPFSNHNGGDLQFGPDGMLYIASGDGGSGNDPQNHGQRLDTVLGKILRIRPDGSIPGDNPFVGEAGARPEIWAFGLRNPWRTRFDRATGELWAADVGQSAREEINLIVRGGNYGWAVCEGTLCDGDPPPDHILPLFEYSHDQGARSVTGGHVYRGTAIPGLQGRYVFADFVSGDVWALAEQDGGLIAVELGTVRLPSTFGEGPDGELYIASYGEGVVLRIQPAP
jgi:glucose/arabinose dehydrogenase